MEGQGERGWRSYAVTLGILAINIIGYLLCTQMGELVYNNGSMNAEKVLVDRQYYRFATYIFLHADIGHIVSNMIYLVGLGQMIEQMIGHVRFAVLYLLSGFGAGAFSMMYSVLTGDVRDAVGASGAIFGLIGALFILIAARDITRRQRGRSDRTTSGSGWEMPDAYENVSVGRLVFVVVYMIYSGTRAVRVDNAAHVGGLVCGLLLMAIMNMMKARRI